MSIGIYKWGWGGGSESVAFWGWIEDDVSAAVHRNAFVPSIVMDSSMTKIVR